MAKDNITSDLLKFILATNYYYWIIDELSDTRFFRHKLKSHIKQANTEMDQVQKSDYIKDFYKIANQEAYLNNVEMHSLFFEKLSKMECAEIEGFMINFLEGKYDGTYTKTKL